MIFSIKPISAEDTYPLRRKVLWPNGPDALVLLADDHLPSTQHFGLFEADQLIGVISLFEQDGAMQFRKLAVDHAIQGKGYGTALLAHVLDVAQSSGTKRLWCNARVTAMPFYARFGFSAEPDSFFKGDEEYKIAYREYSLRDSR
ncbi:GNAT family N-acetyltransferase [Lentilitoribacter sp. Alg239-R112]|uniref:GNAT family N-acetyltransferase n=1 Tax=Lentilitoribacter sp. Alg239-R112 TaxID=2305987 RepID=UPI0013A6EE74|nr:GNAT family N-acetyltransferase [Lentilitoribacter sp. Alg239-R112]